jgi:rare lipoprotein A
MSLQSFPPRLPNFYHNLTINYFERRGGIWMKLFFWSVSVFLIAIPLFGGQSLAYAEVASTYGGSDGLCGSRTASGERLNCESMTAAHRTLPFGTRVRVCHDGCIVVRINDRGPWVRGRHIDLSPAAARAIKLHQTGRVTMSIEM